MQSCDFSTDDLLAFLNRSWNNASVEANTLGGQLVTDQQAALNFIATGSIQHVSKNSTSQGYGGYNPGNLSQRQITAIYTRLIRDFNETLNIITQKATAAGCTLAGYDFDNDVFTALTNGYNALSTTTTRPDIANLSFGGIGRTAGGGCYQQPEGCWSW